MKTSNKTLPLLIIAIVLTLALCGAYLFFFIAMKNKTAATAELSAKSAELSGRQSRIIGTLAVIKGEGENIDKLSTYFIKESEIVAFTQKIELLGAESGTALTLEGLDPGTGAAGEPILNLRILAKGTFQDVMHLMTLLENFPAKFEWKTVEISRDDSFVGQSQTGAKNKTIPVAPQWRVAVSLTARNFVKE